MIDWPNGNAADRLGAIWFVIPAALMVTSVGVNLWLAQSNAALARQALEGQQEINEGLELSRTNTQLIRLIAQLSLDSQDVALRELLARHGISFAADRSGSNALMQQQSATEGAEPEEARNQESVNQTVTDGVGR